MNATMWKSLIGHLLASFFYTCVLMLSGALCLYLRKCSPFSELHVSKRGTMETWKSTTQGHSLEKKCFFVQLLCELKDSNERDEI